MHGKFSFVVAELQPMYNELKSDKIPVLSHVSQFTECLLDALPEFKLQKLDHKNTITYSQEIENLVKNKLKEINQSHCSKLFYQFVNKCCKLLTLFREISQSIFSKNPSHFLF